MMLTRHADYAVRVLMYLAARPGKRVSITTIARDYGISHNHLMKVSQNLTRNGYIVGVRGKGGGITLARDASEINLGRLLEEVEINLIPMNCDTPSCVLNSGCKFAHALDEARAAFLDALAKYNLADLVSGTPSLAAIVAPHP
jgi:Rrf2 family nitric oxide-sensitive transcriptional repressor